MTKTFDLTSQRFARLYVLARNGSDGEGKAVWSCACDCGEVKNIRGKHLRNGSVRSCGCLNRELTGARRRIDATGGQFGRLLAVTPTNERWRGNVIWEFLCLCGSVFHAPLHVVKSGNTQSCGCLQPDVAAELSYVHGMRESPTYTSWAGMKARCLNPANPNFNRYGGRGISVCLSGGNHSRSFLRIWANVRTV